MTFTRFTPPYKPYRPRIKCVECGVPVRRRGSIVAQDLDNRPICKDCLSKGWITDPVEIATELTLDPELREILSPSKKKKDR